MSKAVLNNIKQLAIELPRYILQRNNGYKNDINGVVGRLFEPSIRSHLCYTLERPWYDNKSDNPNTNENESSCIPEGDYLVERTFSNRFQRYTFEIKDVSGRRGIRIHPANVVSELKGCIAPASFLVNKVKHTDHKIYNHYASGSREATNKIEKVLPKIFVLCIVEEGSSRLCKQYSDTINRLDNKLEFASSHA